VDIQTYKEQIEPIPGRDFRDKVVKDMQHRLETKIPV